MDGNASVAGGRAGGSDGGPVIRDQTPNFADARLYLASLFPTELAGIRSAFNRELGRRLRHERERAGITGMRLAAVAGYPGSAISRAERQGMGSLELMLAMCAALLLIAQRRIGAIEPSGEALDEVLPKSHVNAPMPAVLPPRDPGTEQWAARDVPPGESWAFQDRTMATADLGLGPLSGSACAIAIILRRLALALEDGRVTPEMIGLDRATVTVLSPRTNPAHAAPA